MATDPILDHLVLGAGRRGLHRALALLAATPTAALQVVDPLPQPGGTLRTQRTNGCHCELGPFAFAAAELAPFRRLLPNLPPVVEALPTARTGREFDGSALREATVDPPPVTFRTGAEELAQACRRALGPTLRLGRGAVALRPTAAGWAVDLDGQVSATLHTRQLHLATPLAVAARLLGALDPALAAAAERLRTAPHAFVFLAGWQRDLPEFGDFGLLPAAGLDTPIAEVIAASNVFPARALVGQTLLRVEVSGPLLDSSDSELVAATIAELRRWTGARGELGLGKVHRFEVAVPDAAAAECAVRLRGLAGRAPGLLAPVPEPA